MSVSANLANLGTVDYRDAWDIQRQLAAAVAAGDAPDTVLLLEHPPTVTLGRRTEPGELHIPDGADVAVVETDRGGKSTYHGPGQLVCYPILDLTRHGRDVKKYCRDLEDALIRTIAFFGVDATRIEGLTGVWLDHATRSGLTRSNRSQDRDGAAAPEPWRNPGPRKIASIGIHLTKWISTHGYALNVDLDPAPFTRWITACGLDGYQFTSLEREAGRRVTVDDVRPVAAQALADVFGFAFQEAPLASLV